MSAKVINKLILCLMPETVLIMNNILFEYVLRFLGIIFFTLNLRTLQKRDNRS